MALWLWKAAELGAGERSNDRVSAYTMRGFNYLWEGLKEGRNNIWEQEANDFARENELGLRDFLRRKP